MVKDRTREVEAGASTSHPDRPRANSRTNDSHCLDRYQGRMLAGSTPKQTFVDTHAKLNVVFPVLTATGLPQKKGISPVLAAVNQKECLLNHVKGAFSVTHLSYVNPVTNAHLAVPNLPVGARFQNFWQVWLDLNASPKVVQILKEGYTLPFQTRTRLTRAPTVVSCYANPHRNSYLLEALHQLIDKKAVEPVQNQTSLGFFKRLFLVPKPNNKWRPILDLSMLNRFLKTETFKMETPETIRTSLQQGEWVTSLDFKDAYFHVPIDLFNKQMHFQSRGLQLVNKTYAVCCLSMQFSSVLLFTVLILVLLKAHPFIIFQEMIVKVSTFFIYIHFNTKYVKLE